MSRDEKNMAALRKALDYDWPEIQKRLIEKARAEGEHHIDEDGREHSSDEGGRKVQSISFDSWWLDNFDRADVLIELPGVVIMNTKPWHVEGVAATFRAAYGVEVWEEVDDCFTPDDIRAQLERFPEGQFMAMRISGPGAGHAIALAITMRTSRPPTAPMLPWRDAIGGLQLRAHEADGDWLYGVELAVHPMYRGHGIATNLYRARFDLVKKLNLRGWYAVGMLMGYRDYADTYRRAPIRRARHRRGDQRPDRELATEAGLPRCGCRHRLLR